MNPALKRFMRDYGATAEAVARLDLDQEDRERVAEALADALHGRLFFKRDLFVLLATDPLVPCAGANGEPCPTEAVIRVSMHNRLASNGRSAAWRRRAPEVRCTSCGARQFIGAPS